MRFILFSAAYLSIGLAVAQQGDYCGSAWLTAIGTVVAIMWAMSMTFGVFGRRDR